MLLTLSSHAQRALDDMKRLPRLESRPASGLPDRSPIPIGDGSVDILGRACQRPGEPSNLGRLEGPAAPPGVRARRVSFRTSATLGVACRASAGGAKDPGSSTNRCHDPVEVGRPGLFESRRSARGPTGRDTVTSVAKEGFESRWATKLCLLMFWTPGLRNFETFFKTRSSCFSLSAGASRCARRPP